ncbi:hypothetical protein QTO34_000807 [Cnephaeus nilssonii]|uniref:Core shell protein Gag P30 domain-containing protein n=1 Tax=Cnephaeus nilssonii TaxID=3371016 RepID=A0AA40ID36_CNENI|nr:hypothetical protein QTO34_000807 [Eptesicus nilssonii]
MFHALPPAADTCHVLLMPPGAPQSRLAPALAWRRPLTCSTIRLQSHSPRGPLGLAAPPLPTAASAISLTLSMFHAAPWWSAHVIASGSPEEVPLVLPSPYVLQAAPSASPAGLKGPETPPPSISPQPGSPEPVGRPLRSADQGPRSQPACQMPLREIWGAKVVGEDGTLQEGGPVYYYQPFTTSDILNWKHHTPAYSEKPQAMIDFLETIFQTQKPTWVDCKQLLFTFFNPEEHMRVVTEARKWLQTQAPAGILDTDRWARKAFPDEEPDWNPNSEDGRTRLERYWLAFLQGFRAGSKKPTNMAKISEVFQKPDEIPAAFYERLCEAYWIYTPFRPEAPENQTMVNAIFVGQAQPDIRRKLQKLEGFAGKNATELLEIVNKVFINRDSAARKEEENTKKGQYNSSGF